MSFRIFFCAAVLLSFFTAHATAQSPTVAQPTKTSNFIVQGTGVTAKQIAQTQLLCESLKSDLSTTWGLVEQSKKTWSPRCDIVLHATLASYVEVVGPDGAQTKGCSYIGLDKGRVISRRIDLIVEKDGTIPALPHELTHVVVADRFAGKPVPHWFDEGIAMLADSREKQILHERDCHEAIMSNTALSLSKIMNLEQFDSPEQMPAFYGQSLFLVHMLAQQKSPSQLLDFAVDATKIGYDASLRKHYNIEGVKTLEDRWKAHVRDDKAPSKIAVVKLDQPVIFE